MSRAPAPYDRLTHGPFCGHVGAREASVWARAAEAGSYALYVSTEAGAPVAQAAGEAAAGGDLTLRFDVAGLEPGRTYRYGIARRLVPLAAGPEYVLRTAPEPGAPARVKLAFGSCTNHDRFARQAVWDRMAEAGVEAAVLLGDAPYVDSTELERQRARYRELYALPEIGRLLRGTAFYATWDDHDFGANDVDGRLEGKERSRQAFGEYHANPASGEGGEGIYCSFRRGPVEVFLLDTRWFANTEHSPVAPDEQSLLGSRQWEWLKRSLLASTAPFKLLASGIVWNGAVRPLKKDHWESWPHERAALFQFLGEHAVSGVVLVGGDIHRSRALRYPTKEVVGYELTELVTSPLANTVIELANQPSPYLLHDVGIQETFLLVTADTTGGGATLTAQCVDGEGREQFAVTLSGAELGGD